VELARRLVIGRKRDGRCIYDAQAKQELVLACREPGVSMARLARDCGINANQLSTWVRQFERKATKSRPLIGSATPNDESSFVAVRLHAQPEPLRQHLDLKVRLPNGVVVDLCGCELVQMSDLLQALGRLRCSDSTKD